MECLNSLGFLNAVLVKKYKLWTRCRGKQESSIKLKKLVTEMSPTGKKKGRISGGSGFYKISRGYSWENPELRFNILQIGNYGLSDMETSMDDCAEIPSLLLRGVASANLGDC